MDKLKKNYDRVLLAVVAVITLLVGGMLVMKSFAIGNNFPPVDEGTGKTLPETQIAAVESALDHAGKKIDWVYPADPNSPKVFRLFASVPIVWKDNEIMDMYDPDPKNMVRPPMANIYLIDHKLPYNRSDVLARDEDGDGFTNLEEFEFGGTDPRDKNDYPDPTHKLVLDSVVKEDYFLMFASQSGGVDFSVKRIHDDRLKKWSEWRKLGEVFPENTKSDDLNRFKILGFEEKDVHTVGTSAKLTNVGVLTVEDTTSSEKIELVQRGKTNIPIYRAKFRYEIPGNEGALADKEFEAGDTFTLPGTDVEIKVVQVTETTAKLEATKAGGNPKPLELSTK